MASGAVSADLGRNPMIKDNMEALASVTGIVDGTGSVGASAGQLLVPYMDNKAGWTSVFILFMIMCFATFLCLAKLTIRESKDFVLRVRNRRATDHPDVPYEPVSQVDSSTDSLAN